MNEIKEERCPPMCQPNCKIGHHALLIALLNTPDADEETMKVSMPKFKKMVFDHLTVGQLKLSDLVIDPVEEYRIPIGHWACVLGRVKAFEWLVSQGFVTTHQTLEKKETGLQKALCMLQQVCPKDAEKKFAGILPHAWPQIHMKNELGNTILHLCCDMLKRGIQKERFFMECLKSILQYCQTHDPDVLEFIVNQKNGDGDTPLHIVAVNDQLTRVAQLLVDAGCDIEAKNREDLNALELAVDRGAIKMGMFLNVGLHKQKQKIKTKDKVHEKASEIITKEWKEVKATEETAMESTEQIGAESSEADVDNIAADNHEEVVDTQESANLQDGEHTLVRTGYYRSTVERELTNRVQAKATAESNIQATSDSENELSDEEMEFEEEVAMIQTSDGQLIPLIPNGVDFLNLLKISDTQTKIQIMQALESKNTENTAHLKSTVEKHNDVKCKLYALQGRQKTSVDCIQNYLLKLNQLENEESRLVTKILKFQSLSNATQVTLKGLKERLQHCRAALDALDGL